MNLLRMRWARWSRSPVTPFLCAMALLAGCGTGDPSANELALADDAIELSDAGDAAAAANGFTADAADESIVQPKAMPTRSVLDAAFGARPGVQTPAQAARFLNQATFGATVKALADLRSTTPSGWIDQQFQHTRSNTYLAHATSLGRTPVLSLPAGTYTASTMFGRRDNDLNVNMVWRPYIAYQPNQLRRRVGAALASIFVVNSRVAALGLANNFQTTGAFMDLLEEEAFGNFRDILMSVSRAPAMGVFLSFVDNRRAEYDASGNPTRVPDENYAREIMQLFSIGLYELNLDGTLKPGADGQPIPTYDQDDVFNLARVFTGLVLAERGDYVSPMVVKAANHSPEAIRFLNTAIPAGTPTLQAINRAVDALFNHPNVGPFIGRQLIQRLVTSNPSPAYVRRVALAFNNNGKGVRGDMKAVIRAILLDEEARVDRTATPNVQGKLREPMIRLTAVARLLGATSSNRIFPIADLSDSFTGIGQAPLKSPSVFYFFRPGYVPPNSQIAERGLVAPEFQILDGSAILSGINVINAFVDRAPQLFDLDLDYLDSLASDATKLIDFVSLMLTADELDATARADFIQLVGAIPAARRWDRIRAAVQLVASSPAFLVQK